MVETRNWLEMPHEIMGGMIGAVEILISAQKVCTTWRRICKDPAMWKIIDLDHAFHHSYTKNDFEKLSKQAVHRSCGELIDISLKRFGTDDLYAFISRCSSKLNSLSLTKCHGITGSGLIHAIKRLPHLEALSLFYTPIDAEDLKVIGPICPQLKSFKIKTWLCDCEGVPDVIANTMPALRHLQLFGTTIMDSGIYAILDGCPHLESLDVRSSSYLYVDRNLEQLCRERIKDFKLTVNILFESSPEAYAHEDYELSDSDPDSFYGGYEFSAGNAISP